MTRFLTFLSLIFRIRWTIPRPGRTHRKPDRFLDFEAAERLVLLSGVPGADAAAAVAEHYPKRVVEYKIDPEFLPADIADDDLDDLAADIAGSHIFGQLTFQIGNDVEGDGGGQVSPGHRIEAETALFGRDVDDRALEIIVTEAQVDQPFEVDPSWYDMTVPIIRILPPAVTPPTPQPEPTPQPCPCPCPAPVVKVEVINNITVTPPNVTVNVGGDTINVGGDTTTVNPPVVTPQPQPPVVQHPVAKTPWHLDVPWYKKGMNPWRPGVGKHRWNTVFATEKPSLELAHRIARQHGIHAPRHRAQPNNVAREHARPLRLQGQHAPLHHAVKLTAHAPRGPRFARAA